MGIAAKTNVIVRAGEVLMALAEGLDRVGKIAQRTNLSMSTVHRILKSLEDVNLVVRNEVNRRYLLGPLFISLASNPAPIHRWLVDSASPYMKSLWEFSEETVSLHISIGIKRLCLEELPSFQSIKHMSGVGYRAPIYAGAPGKVLLSAMKESECRKLLQSIDLVPITPNTITNKDKLMDQLVDIRKQGYSTSLGEKIPESACISALVNNYSCPVVLSVFGPHYRFSHKDDHIIKMTVETADLISRHLKRLGRAENQAQN